MTPRASATVAWLIAVAAFIVPAAQAEVPAAAAPLQARVPFGPVLVGELTQVTGRVTVGGRPLELHVRDQDRWRLLESGVAGPDGAFSFPVRVTRADTRFEVRAPRLKRDGVIHPAEPPAAFDFRAVAPKASLDVFTAPVGQSRSGMRDLTPATATFSPRRPGAAVTLERRDGDSWVTVGTGTQDGVGRFTAQVDAGSPDAPHTFRAATEPAAGAAPVYSEAVTAEVWRQVWADEFSGSTLGPHWAERRSDGVSRSCALTSPANTTVAQGWANLVVTEDKSRRPDKACPFGRFFNAHIGTQNSKTFQYGVFAARVRFSPEKGQHGAFWLQPGGVPSGPLSREHAGSEIDVVEYFGDDELKGGLQSWVYWNHRFLKGKWHHIATGGPVPAAEGLLGAGRTPSNSAHVFSLEWTPEEYVFRVDGVETFRTSDGVAHRPEFLILSMLSSDWELPLRPKGTSSPMSVDWVRVWQR